MNKRISIYMLCVAIVSAMLLIGCGKTDTEQETTKTTEVSDEAEKDDSAETEPAQESMDGVPNPWEESSEEKITEIMGCCFQTPVGAEDVLYQVMNKDELAEMQFTLEGMRYTARLKKTDGLTDISGMYYDWTLQEEGELAGVPGKYMRYLADGEDTVDVQLWYDEYNSVTYCLSVSAPDLDGFDISAVAMQGYLGPTPEQLGIFMPNDFLQEREQRDIFGSYEEIIGLLWPGEAYAYVELEGASDKMLAIAPSAYDNGDGNMASIEVYIYGPCGDGIRNIGNVFSSGTAYPVACDGGILYAAGNHNYESSFLTEDGEALMIKEMVSESFDENGNASYYGFLREKNSFDPQWEKDVAQDDEALFYDKIREYTTKKIINFTVVK